MGVSLIALLLLINTQLQEKFTKNLQGIDAVLGAKGSPLQIILSSIYQVDYPTGNISLATANKVAKHPLVKKTIPLAYGDRYESYRIVGTSADYLNHYQAEFRTGQIWSEDLEAVLGATAARDLGLKIGDTFESSHGLVAGGETHAHQHFKVVGILKPNNSVVDQLILCSVASVWAVHEHKHEETISDSTKQAEREITALFLSFRNPAMGVMQLRQRIPSQSNLQMAVPVFEVNRLLGQLGVGITVLRTVALLIILMAGISVFVSLYHALQERQYELALMRSMGASRGQLFRLVMLESLLLSFLGFINGWLLSRLGMWLFTNLFRNDYHYHFHIPFFTINEAYLFVCCLIVGFGSALLPALQAFYTNISATLSE